MFDSLKREVGKNTGKAISNAIFGDSHSTPYRRVESDARTAARQVEAESKAKARRDEAKLRKWQAEQEEKARRRAELNSLDAAVLKAIDDLNAQLIPNTEPELIELMSHLTVQLNATPYNKNKVEGEYHNKFLFALIEKYNQGIFMLQTISPLSPHLAFYQNLLQKKKKSVKWEKLSAFMRQHWIITGIVVFFAAMVALYLFAAIANLIQGIWYYIRP